MSTIDFNVVSMVCNFLNGQTDTEDSEIDKIIKALNNVTDISHVITQPKTVVADSIPRA